MTTQPDMDALARHFADLWQEQWLQFMHSKETAGMMGRMSSFFTPAPEASPYDRSNAFAPGHASGASATAAALDALTQRVDELAQRVDSLCAKLDEADKPRTARPSKPASASKPNSNRPRPAQYWTEED